MSRLIIAVVVITTAFFYFMGTPEQPQPVLVASGPSQPVYPVTQRGEVIDTYFGVEVADPYRWLEDDMSDQTGAWVKAQNAVTHGYLKAIPYRSQIEQLLTQKWDYEKPGRPIHVGESTYWFFNSGLQNQSVMYQQRPGEEARVFLDPNTLAADGTTSLASYEFSPDGQRMAYAVSEGGSDWRKIYVMDTTTLAIVDGPIVDAKFTTPKWRDNNSFYYSVYEKPDGSELSAKTDRHLVYLHQLGTPQHEDTLAFGDAEKYRYVFAQVTEDGRFLVVNAANSTSGNRVFVKDLSANEGFISVDEDISSDTDFVTSMGDELFFLTNHNAPNKRLVALSLAQPDQWRDVIAESEHVLDVTAAGGYLFSRVMVDATFRLYQHKADGTIVREVVLPDVGTADVYEAKADQAFTYYYFYNNTTPISYYRYDITTGESRLHSRHAVDFDSDQYVSKQVFYTSKDGTRVPMMISHKKGITLDGNTPTMLYGYGGFNISMTPQFSLERATWMELGGIYAVANLRGGGEYGKAWHRAGTKQQKQNVFDDFISAAEYLIAEGYTSSARLAISGRSNGGLLVGATMAQRPELFAVALPAVGVLDMLRYHQFTAGAGWAYDYGTADDSLEMFEYLKAYSPLHSLQQGVAYPATLVTTADHDDRVVPAHSFKFAAELQHKHGGSDPVLIRIETSVGHGAGKPTDKAIEELADMFAFTLWNMGVETL
ncbi:MAG TPA: prolyl oligopeptidase family serine peptidase [Pseudomonadales bacterium]|nr:prolyl oligopeptidase family serine peptidase [Pseudomonadales bacterium]